MIELIIKETKAERAKMHRRLSIIVILLIFLSASYTQAKILPSKKISAYDAAKSHILQNVRQKFSKQNLGNADLNTLTALSSDIHRNRYYQPKYGRFISKDPIGFNGDINLYRYANDNPVLFTDPFGLLTEAQCKALLKDIKRLEVARQRIDYMFLRWKVGDSWADYGLEIMSTASGVRKPIFNGMSPISKKIAEEKVYNLPMSVLMGSFWLYQDAVIGTIDKIISGQPYRLTHDLTDIRLETIRIAIFLRNLRLKHKEECKEKCKEN